MYKLSVSQRRCGRQRVTDLCAFSNKDLIFVLRLGSGSYKKRQKNTYIFYCAQIEGEETLNKKVEDEAKRRARMKMDRFGCRGWLRITVDNNDLQTVKVWLTH